VLDVERRFTRAARSSTVVVDGLLSSMVNRHQHISLVDHPSWFIVAIPGAVSRHEDRSMFMTRIEITCTACGGHLGHVFKGEGFDTPSTLILVYEVYLGLTILQLMNDTA